MMQPLTGRIRLSEQVEQQPASDLDLEPKAEVADVESALREDSTRVNIAEEFYLRVTERSDVREILRRLANL